MIKRNGLTLPLNDAHVLQRRGIVIAYKDGEPLHFTLLRCLDGEYTRIYFGAARKDNIQDFESIIDYGDKFEMVTKWLAS
ncbi:hypothetical protein FM038_001615 [Shewanella eurypsychrophilus]|uniref:Uncharacterized protein n=1 Tax=Shewanella eurypsychrophilus TaxID=2593656 RepID=A0ABX6V107_9GAMM|nr:MULTISPECIES: hypothetical protein [Shewanella]QFU20697.1 hypothetical protein FS418_01595 [Shewanella sp. YLB-09]QFU20977.1 hypothetical protein FS418_03205 [Shewanella sp. YLB-09]QPG56265.1 hypothetical protein FM038_001615 [Shewanella eurypsychrophilus]